MESKYLIKMTNTANRNMDDISDYISDELMNPVAAMDLIDDLERTIKKRLDIFPYGYPVHTFLESLGIEYRRTVIGNFTVFYKIIEPKKEEEKGLVVVNHIVYSVRDFEKIVINDEE